jgi:ABC-type transporter Mla MlaB component
MLRVTVEDGGDQIVFRVEGKLKGPWVIELEKCWRSISAHATGKTLGMNLDGVDFIDDQGQALLMEMARAGVEPIATGLMMRSIVQQIVSANSLNSRKDTSELASKAEFKHSMEEHNG